MRQSISIFKIAIATLLTVANPATAESPLKVTTTLSSYADIAKTIGGDLVEVKYVASPRFNPHFIEPKPSDVLKVKNSDLFIHSGLDLEAWRSPLIDAAGRADIRQSGERQLDLSAGIKLLEIPDRQVSRAEGDIHLFGNPHYWLDPRNGKIIADEIATKLSSLDSKHKDEYQKNLTAFQAKIDEKISVWIEQLAPFRGQELIGYHNEWAYLMNFSGLTMKYFLEPKPGIPPTPQQIEFIIRYANEQKVKAIIKAIFNPEEAAVSVANRTKVKVLTLCQNVGEIAQASDYVAMIDYNISKIVEAMHND